MADEILSNSDNLIGSVEINPADYTVLVVDDVDANILLIKMMLQREHYKILTCKESPLVHDICINQKPDIILQDVMMPVMDGYEVVRQLKADPLTADIPVIFLTAYNDREHTLTGFESGGSDYVGKPLERDILLARLNAHLKIVKARRIIMQRNEDLKNTLTSRDKMYSVIAHDLRGPLGVVQVTLKALTDILPPEVIGQAESEMLVECNKQVSDLFTLLDNLLKWTKSQTGALKVVYQDFQASMLSDIMMDTYSSLATAKGITLSLGAVDETIQVHSDADMCQTILRNLLSNAIKFTESGKNVSLSITSDGDFAVISVVDEGCGLTEEEQGKLFNKDTHFTKYGTNREEGSGLGLMLCKGFVDQLGGKLTLESKVGVGSTFRVFIPLSK